MINQIEFVSIFDIISNLKNEYKYLPDTDTNQKIHSSLEDGVVYKNAEINIAWSKYHNHILNSEATFYFFICPNENCQRRVRKIYIKDFKLGCRKCLSVRGPSPRTETPTNRLLNIHYGMTQLLTNPSMGTKKKEQVVSSIINQYSNLDDNHTRTAYFSMVFNIFQKHLLDKLTEKSSNKETKACCRELLFLMRDIKRILYFT